MKQLIKTLIFIMKHGRMRLGLVKRIRKAQRREYGRMFIEKHGRAPNMPAFNPSPPPKRISNKWKAEFAEAIEDYVYKSISSEFPNLPQPPKRPKTPKRKFTDNEIGGAIWL